MQLTPAILCVSTLASEAASLGASRQVVRSTVFQSAARPQPKGLPPLPLVPAWSQLLELSGEPTMSAQLWRTDLPAAPVERLDLREVYALIAELPELDRVGRFAHVDFLMVGLSAGPELQRLAPQPAREEYPRTQQLATGGSLWYESTDQRWAVGLATSTRFLLAEQSSALVDPFTSEARWAFFLP